MMTPETHDHATTCEITMGRGCDCGLTGMAGVDFYMKGEAVYKKPVERGALMNPPAAFDVAARTGRAELQQEGERHLAMLQKYEEVYSEVRKKVFDGICDWLKPRPRPRWGDAVDVRKMDAAQLLEILKSQK